MGYCEVITAAQATPNQCVHFTGEVKFGEFTEYHGVFEVRSEDLRVEPEGDAPFLVPLLGPHLTYRGCNTLSASVRVDLSTRVAERYIDHLTAHNWLEPFLLTSSELLPCSRVRHFE